MSESVASVEGAACRPNISPAGVRRRRQIGLGSAVVSALVAAAFAWGRARWFWCLLVFFPAATAGISALQASRRTCVARAKEGTVEHDDFSTTPAAPEDAHRSREVAAGITRDGVLIGLAAVGLTILASRLAASI